MRKILLLPDENFYLTIIKNNIDPILIDNIENNMGNVVLDEKINDKLTKYISLRRSVFEREILKTTIDRYTDNFIKIKNEISQNKKIPSEIINTDILEIKEHIKQKINNYNNTIQDEDIILMSLSYYIRETTEYEPIIISDDKHILIYGNLISSFYGLAISYLSMYELLKISKQEVQLKKYLTYKSIADFQNYSIKEKINKEELQNAIYKILKSNLITVHPKPNNRDNAKAFLRY